MGVLLPPGVTRVVVPQIVATRGVIPSTPVVGTNIMTESRLTVKNGCQPCTDIRLAMCGFSVDSAAGGETAIPNDITYNLAIERTTPAKAIRASLNGATDIVIKGTSGITLSDPVGVDLAADEVFKVQYGQMVADTTKTYLASYNLPGLAEYYRATALTSTQVGTAGAWSATGRSSNQNTASSPVIIGRPAQNYPSVIFLGDSIMASRDDLVGDAFGNHGYARGLYTAGPNGSAMPYANLSRSGERASTVALGNHTMRMSMLQYCSHVICNWGTNDIQAGRTFAQVTADLTTAWASIKRRGVKVFQCLILPRTTSTDNWATAANQTPVAGFATSGIRDQVNAWILSQVGILIDGTINGNTVLEDQSNQGKWVTTGAANYSTTDGIHPTDAAMALVAPLVLAVAQTFTLNQSVVRL